jgi:ribosome-associated protein
VAVTDRARRLAETAALAAADKLAHDVVAIDVSERLPLTDCFVIASAPSERQVAAVVDGIEERLRTLDAKPVRREGQQEARWVLLDFADIVVHVLHTEEREYYGLERLWKDCPSVPLPAEVYGPPAGADDSDPTPAASSGA